MRGGRTRKRREEALVKERVGKKRKVSRERASDGREVERKGEKSGQKERMGKVLVRRGATGKGGEWKRKAEPVKVWEEELVRVGTGYRVRKEEGVREFDLGYSDMKEYVREKGVSVEVAKNNMGRVLKYEGDSAREKAMNRVCKRESMRKRSVYTGCGRTRKSRVGKKKLKPTKVRAR